MVATKLPSQLSQQHCWQGSQHGLIYRGLLPLQVEAIGQPLSTPLWPGSNINS